MAKTPIRVAVTGAAGNIAYSLIFRLAAGDVFGPDQPVALNLVDIEPMRGKVEAIVMELNDCAFPLVTDIKVATDPMEGFKDCNWCLLVGSVPRKDGMERKDLLGINGKIFVGQGKAVAAVAAKDVKVFVVGNPCNTNCLIACRNAAGVPENRFFAMTHLDENRAKSFLAEKAGVHSSAVKNMTIWGNHSSTQFPDFTNATINGVPATEVITDKAWLENDFIPLVQKRGGAVIKARGASSAASAANAALETVRKLSVPTPEGDWFSVAMMSNGEYGTEPGIITGFPVRTLADGSHEIVKGLTINDFARAKIDATVAELKEERATASEALGIKL